MDGDAGHGDVGGRHAPVLQVGRAFLGGGEVVVAGLVDPQAVRFEVGGHGELRRFELALRRSEAMISAGRKCVLTITSHVPAERNGGTCGD